jgi:hypothetical protein
MAPDCTIGNKDVVARKQHLKPVKFGHRVAKRLFNMQGARTSRDAIRDDVDAAGCSGSDPDNCRLDCRQQGTMIRKDFDIAACSTGPSQRAGIGITQSR